MWNADVDNRNRKIQKGCLLTQAAVYGKVTIEHIFVLFHALFYASLVFWTFIPSLLEFSGHLYITSGQHNRQNRLLVRRV